MRISRQSHTAQPGGCLVEIVSLLLSRQAVRNGVVDPDWMCAEKTDMPHCLSLSVTHAATRVNDALPDAERQKLALFIPRLIRARKLPKSHELRVAVRLALWAARSVEHLVEPQVLERYHKALAASEQRLWDDSVVLDDDHHELGWAGACHAAAGAAVNPFEAVSNVVRALSFDDPELLLMWFDELLDAWEKAVVEEGCALYDPTIEYPPDDEVQAVIDAILCPT